MEMEREIELQPEMQMQATANTGPIQTQKQDILTPNEKDSESESKYKEADHVYIFCPTLNKGIMFYDQSPISVEAFLTGSLPSGKFWSSKEEIVEWNEEINGKWDPNVSVSDYLSIMTNKQKANVISPGGKVSTITQTTIIVSPNNMVKLLNQLDNPVMSPNNNSKVLDLNSVVMDYNEINAYEQVASTIKR